MNTLKKRRNEFPVFGDVMTNLFDHSLFGEHLKMPNTNTPKVNIVENEKNYEIHLASPGMSKDQFEIDLKENTLTISGKTKTEKEEKNESQKYTLREFNYTDFKRSFKLPKNVEIENIKANYFDGILEVQLPKTEQKENEIKKIEIH